MSFIQSLAKKKGKKKIKVSHQLEKIVNKVPEQRRYPRCANPLAGEELKRLEEERKWKSQEEEPGKCKSTVRSEKEVIFKLQWIRNQ